MRVIDNWLNATIDCLSSLQNASLEQLLETESLVEQSYRDGDQVAAAPRPSRLPESYATLVPGNERKRQTRLGWWDRFQTSDGLVPSIARVLVAGAVVVSVLSFSVSVGTANVTIHNGLAREVLVKIDDHETIIGPFSTAMVNLQMGEDYTVTAVIRSGRPIETFEAEIGDRFAHYVYNVAGAAPLVEWTQTYGNASPREDRYLGVNRWFMSEADVFFEAPPESVRSNTGGAKYDVLSGLGQLDPESAANFVSSEEEFYKLVRAHVRWDSSQSENYQLWMQYAGSLADIDQILADRREDGFD